MAIVLVTGANRGLGFEFVRQYARDGWRVLACCRHPAGPQALTEIVAQSDGDVTTHQVDVTDFVRIEGLAHELKDAAIDVLINCAGTAGKYTIDEGAMAYQAFGKFDGEEWMQVYRVNVMGPMKMSEAFIEQVVASDQKKIITLTSELGSIGFNSSGNFYPYRASKAAVNAIMKSMSIDLAEKGVIAIPLHPGWVSTDMGGKNAPVGVGESVTGMRKVIDGLTMAKSGRYLTYEGKEMPW